MSVAVVGAGLAGLAASSRLQAQDVAAVVYESTGGWGGHARSCRRDGYTFDEGPHVSFTADEDVQQVFASGCDVMAQRLRLSNTFKGRRLAHPAQCHLHGLPADLITNCIVDFASAQQHPQPVANYEDWCINSFGKAFAKTFALPYTRKYWTVEARDLSTEWIGQRIYQPSLGDVVRGALGAPPRDGHHYITTIRYPAAGGFQAFARALLRPQIIQFEKSVVGVDPANRVLILQDRTTASYDELISTMPLPELVRAISCTMAIPPTIRAAATQLAYSSVLLVDIALATRPETDDHIVYLYDEEIPAARIHFPHLLAPDNCPEGTGSIQAEIYFSRARPLPADADSLVRTTVGDLVGLGFIKSAADVRWARHRVLKYANVIFTHDHAPNVALIRAWIEGFGIQLAGRYGEWAYQWSDDAVRSGWHAANCVVTRLQRSRDRVV